jgi:DmsE family decaheme c-type cytochrome
VSRRRASEGESSKDARGRRGVAASFISGVFMVSVLVIFFACAEGRVAQEPENYHRTQSVEGADEPLGAARCDSCHGHQPAPRHHAECESCHGSGQRHVQNVMDPAWMRFPSNDDCLGCHETGHRGLLGWDLSEHQRAGLLCADCHDPHNGEPFHVRLASDLARNVLPHARPDTRLCVSCHTEVASRLNLPSHHPVREGMLGCTDCHSPHESQKTRLGAQTAQCTECHQAQAGPFIYEHTPVAEDCGYCHVPHGSSADSLLSATQPGACVYCHTLPEMAATHDPQAFVTRCTDCHGAVHGSFADPHLRR